MNGGQWLRLASKRAVAITGTSAAVPGKGVVSLKIIAAAPRAMSAIRAKSGRALFNSGRKTRSAPAANSHARVGRI